MNNAVITNFKETNALKYRCSDKSLAEVAKELKNCDGLWPYLGIGEAAHEEIKRDNPVYRNYKLQLLLAWRHHRSQATYQKLCDTFKEWGDTDIIDVVKKQALCGQWIVI